MKSSLVKIVIVAFVIRIAASFIGEHGDVISYYWWGKDLLGQGLAGFYEREIVNAMPPAYPPVTSYILYLSALLHETIWKISWFLNVKIQIFPSNFIFWLESAKGWYFINKLPAIFADIGIVWVLYKFSESLKKKTGLVAASLFAFSPPFWYNSSIWGQTDSLYALPLISAFYALHKKKKLLSAFLVVFSILTKPTALFVLPVFALWWLKGAGLKNIFQGVVVSLGQILLLYFPFHPEGLVSWIFNFYYKSLGGELSYIVANAFNFWGLVFGFGEVPEKVSFLGFPAYTVGYFVFLVTIVFLVFYVWQKKYNSKNYILLSILVSFLAFLILPRIHERYFYPTLLLLIPIAFDKRIRKTFWLLSGIHLVNLYHFWWVPRLDFLVEIFSLRWVENTFILFNISLFVYLVLIFKNEYAKKS